MKRLPTLVLLASALIACSEGGEQGEDVAVERATSVTVVQADLRDIDYVLTALGTIESIHHPTVSAETSGQIVSVKASEG